MKKKTLCAALFCVLLLLCAACGPSPAAGLDALISLDPGEVETVVCTILTPIMHGQSFVLTRGQHPEEVAGLIDMFSRNREDYALRGDAFADYSPNFAVSYLDRKGNTLLTVYEHDTRTVSFGSDLYRCGVEINTYPFNLALAAAGREGRIK